MPEIARSSRLFTGSREFFFAEDAPRAVAPRPAPAPVPAPAPAPVVSAVEAPDRAPMAAAAAPEVPKKFDPLDIFSAFDLEIEDEFEDEDTIEEEWFHPGDDEKAA